MRWLAFFSGNLILGSAAQARRRLPRNEEPLRVADDRVFAHGPSLCDRDVCASGNGLLVDTGTTEKSTGTVGIPYGARCMALRVPGNAMEPVGFQNRTSPGRFTGRNAAATTFTGMGLKRILTAIRLIQLNRLTCLKMISSQRHWNSWWIWLCAVAGAALWPAMQLWVSHHLMNMCWNELSGISRTCLPATFCGGHRNRAGQN